MIVNICTPPQVTGREERDGFRQRSFVLSKYPRIVPGISFECQHSLVEERKLPCIQKCHLCCPQTLEHN